MVKTINLSSIDRSIHRWDKKELDAFLVHAWRNRIRAIVLPFTIYNIRKIAAVKRRLDRQGWSLTAKTQLRSGTLAVYVRQRYRGARPSRG